MINLIFTLVLNLLSFFSSSYLPPHVRRRLKVQEMMQKYRSEMTQSELLTYLFSGQDS